MTLEEIRVQIDAIDTEMKQLFLKRMDCAQMIAETKAISGGDVFAPEREASIIEKRASGVENVYDEYVTFLRHLMSVSRRYQYGILTGMQNRVIASELEKAGLDGNTKHNRVKIAFFCCKNNSDLNLFINMIRLNQVPIVQMNLVSEENTQKVTMVLEGSLGEDKVRCLICQIAKEAADFKILELG